jgi:hypothetical protein
MVTSWSTTFPAFFPQWLPPRQPPLTLYFITNKQAVTQKNLVSFEQQG